MGVGENEPEDILSVSCEGQASSGFTDKKVGEFGGGEEVIVGRRMMEVSRSREVLDEIGPLGPRVDQRRVSEVVGSEG